MARALSVVHEEFSPRQMRNVVMTAADAAHPHVARELARLGINVGDSAAMAQMIAFANDAAPNVQATVFAGSMATPAQFLQAWLPGFVSTITAVRSIDELAGIVTVGDWEDEEIVQGVVEPTGLAQVYGDQTNAPLASWNVGYERRAIVRFEQGFEVGILEDKRTAKARLNTSARKRAAAGIALDIQRNRVGFYGFNGGAGRTYGFLNDPSLPAYVTVAAGVGGTTWAVKTFLEITADIRAAVGALVVQGGGLIKSGVGRNTTPMTLALPLGADNQLSVTSETGAKSVAQWLVETYPNMRVITAPELAGANGGANVFYLYAENVDDGQSDDGGRTLIQMVPTKFMTLGAEKRIKTYVEDFSNATAGVMWTRPYAVVRRSGI